MATSKILKPNKYDGYAKWANQTVSNSSWATNTGNNVTLKKPSGVTETSAFNLHLDIPGTYLLIYHANFAILNATGLRGIRFYVNDVNVGEEFVAPSSNGTSYTTTRIVTSDGTDYVRMGLYQSSGSSASVNDIFIAAIKLS